MKIVVCIKQVVDTTDIRWTKNNTIDREGVQSVINPCDLLALETALRIKDLQPEKTKISVITMGPAQAEDALKTAIAMGCDEAVLLSDKKFSGADTVATSRTLATAIKNICPDFNLVISGQFASDGDTAQTGPSVAQRLGVEQVTYVSEILKFVDDNKIQVLRTSDSAVELVETPLPALLCICDTPYTQRDIKISGYIKSQESHVKVLSADELGLERDKVGVLGSPTRVSRAFRAESNRENKIYKEDCFNKSDVVSKVVDLLSAEVNKIRFDSSNKDGSSSEHDSCASNIVLENAGVSFSKKVLIFGETTDDGDFVDVVYELASKAKSLVEFLADTGITVITTNKLAKKNASKLALYGVNELIIIDDDRLMDYNTQNYARAMVEYLQKFPVDIFLIGATRQGRDFAPQISSALNTGLTADCTGLDINEYGKLAATRPTFGGELMATILCSTLPQMATVRPGVFNSLLAGESDDLSIAVNYFKPEVELNSQKRVVKKIDFEEKQNPLKSAQIIFAGGRGLKNKATFEKLEKLANLLSVKVGATRKVVDAGFADHSVQIGQTGETVSPELYIAFGVSGAVQHCVGISGAKRILAINTDASSPIVKSADLTFVADASLVIDEWISRLTSDD